MAVQRTPKESRLQLQYQVGTDEEGKPVIKNRYFNNIKHTATDENVYDGALTLAGLQEHMLLAVQRIDTGVLDEF
ncbi:MAG: DUF1659 domain-containing protein [Firmicutes bacterium]|nr:DUF1659 domain-containing protein [Bacillota bacterium]